MIGISDPNVMFKGPGPLLEMLKIFGFITLMHVLNIIVCIHIKYDDIYLYVYQCYLRLSTLCSLPLFSAKGVSIERKRSEPMRDQYLPDTLPDLFF